MIANRCDMGGIMNFDRDDLTMFYDIRGTGTQVLMLHGLTLDHRNMVGAMEPVFGNTKADNASTSICVIEAAPLQSKMQP